VQKGGTHGSWNSGAGPDVDVVVTGGALGGAVGLVGAGVLVAAGGCCTRLRGTQV
jgi:hypothetical protein